MSTETQQADNFLLLHPTDNILVCIQASVAGQSVTIEGAECSLDTDIGVGHKIARRPIEAGEKILRYGVSIGTATSAIATGHHIHGHNMKSDYIASTRRDSASTRSEKESTRSETESMRSASNRVGETA